ncbi:polymorphic toxin type 44 domain-containing protein [Pseudomonas sp. RGM2987]|uniref:polymorphic toxin type 44 domain-containing protein n=1 Tax=Pseudomonas sp. RGM2987 TaxID=2930090 RepID=UPI001FD6E83C|nr:polymorphic toxin type 44 domain-containing protein [Pseudomonas sp. RGM2987]MCJ8205798.1 polymorphic toxin type 44 domain-containing protein [Pseudomonas sp. RGM2987]
MTGTLDLPPLLITPDGPLPNPPGPISGIIAKPIPWNGQVVEVAELESFFKRRDVTSQHNVMTVIFTVFQLNKSIDDSYNTYFVRLSSELNAEITAAVGSVGRFPLDRLKAERNVVAMLLAKEVPELAASSITASAFFGGSPFDRTMKKRAVDFVNILGKRNGRSPLNTYKDWLKSIAAAYRRRVLAERVRILTEKSQALAAAISAAEAEENFRVWGGVIAWAAKYNSRKEPIVKQYNFDKANVERNVQSKLDVASATISGSIVTPADWVNKAIQVVTQVLSDNRRELSVLGSVLARHSDIDFKNQDLRAFLERTRDGNIDPDVSFAQELLAIQAAYRSDVLNDEIWSLEQRLLKLIAAQEKQAEERAATGIPPLSPPDVKLDANLEEAKKLRQAAEIIAGGEAYVLGVFYSKVRNNGDWDYKQRGREFEEFGNFNYGATGTAAGIPEQILLRAAGAAQSVAGTSREEFGKWWGQSPYGDDRMDQIWIKAGIDYAKSKGF